MPLYDFGRPRTQVAQGDGLQIRYSWVQIPPRPLRSAARRLRRRAASLHGHGASRAVPGPRRPRGGRLGFGARGANTTAKRHLFINLEIYGVFPLPVPPLNTTVSFFGNIVEPHQCHRTRVDQTPSPSNNASRPSNGWQSLTRQPRSASTELPASLHASLRRPLPPSRWWVISECGSSRAWAR
ncbi:MAG: hypothetical protein RL254_2120 [Planctomycetota bacterium]